VRGRIAQGSPVSSDALNFFLFDADRALYAASAKIGVRYGRTYDDMVMSVDSSDLAEWPGNAMRKQIQEHGLTINTRKLRKTGFQPRHKEQRVHNLVVTSRRGVRIPDEHAEKAVALANSYVRGSAVVDANSLEGLARKRASLVGWMHHCRQADFGPARHIRTLLDAGDRRVDRMLASIGLVPHRKKWWLVVNGGRNEPSRLARLWRSLRSAA
jgi:hypothetical protein